MTNFIYKGCELTKEVSLEKENINQISKVFYNHWVISTKKVVTELIQEKVCLVCKGRKTSLLEMNCTFCNSGEMDEESIIRASKYKEVLINNGIINKKEYLLL